VKTVIRKVNKQMRKSMSEIEDDAYTGQAKAAKYQKI
jgi:hypothetical protein